MVSIKIVDPAIVDKFKQILASEDDDDAVFRIKETKVGGGCKSHMELLVGIDEVEDDDQKVQVEGLPFVISEDVVDSYGSSYEIYTDTDKGQPAVRALD